MAQTAVVPSMMTGMGIGSSIQLVTIAWVILLGKFSFNVPDAPLASDTSRLMPPLAAGVAAQRTALSDSNESRLVSIGRVPWWEFDGW